MHSWTSYLLGIGSGLSSFCGRPLKKPRESEKNKNFYQTILPSGPRDQLPSRDFESKHECHFCLINLFTILLNRYWIGPSALKWSSMNALATETPLSNYIFWLRLCRQTGRARQKPPTRKGTNFIHTCFVAHKPCLLVSLIFKFMPYTGRDKSSHVNFCCSSLNLPSLRKIRDRLVSILQNLGQISLS